MALEGPEVVHETRRTFSRVKHEAPPWVTLLALIGWLLVATGVVGEATAEALLSHVDTGIQGLNDARLSDAMKQAGYAKESAVEASRAAASAVSSARDAKREADAYMEEIESAVALASDAESHLRDALSQAESASTLAKGYASDIASARKDALEAKTLLVEAQNELARLRTPRSISDIEGLTASLAPYKGASYTFTACFGDTESINLLKGLRGALEAAGWKFIKPSTTSFSVITINDESGHAMFSVEISVAVGVEIHFDAVLPIEELQRSPPEILPPHIREAIVLRNALSLHISPKDERNVASAAMYDLPNKSGSNVVKINVGRKP